MEDAIAMSVLLLPLLSLAGQAMPSGQLQLGAQVHPVSMITPEVGPLPHGSGHTTRIGGRGQTPKTSLKDPFFSRKKVISFRKFMFIKSWLGLQTPSPEDC